MTGLRPIVEIMWVDFTLVAMDQIVNQAANVATCRLAKWLPADHPNPAGAPARLLRSAFSVPGGTLLHIPGIRVGLPASAQDAYDMTLAAISCNDPVLVIENRGLYHGEKQQVSLGGPIEAIGGALIARPGVDATLV